MPQPQEPNKGQKEMPKPNKAGQGAKQPGQQKEDKRQGQKQPQKGC